MIRGSSFSSFAVYRFLQLTQSAKMVSCFIPQGYIIVRNFQKSQKTIRGVSRRDESKKKFQCLLSLGTSPPPATLARGPAKTSHAQRPMTKNCKRSVLLVASDSPACEHRRISGCCFRPLQNHFIKHLLIS